MDMELWTNTELLQYVDELMTKFHSFSIILKDAKAGADALLSMWPSAKKPPPTACELLEYDARAILLSKVPDFRSSVLEFSGLLKKMKTSVSKLDDDASMNVEYYREVACREKLYFALSLYSSNVGFKMARDIQESLTRGVSYEIAPEDKERENFTMLLNYINRKIGLE
jgi:hypothetical protein